MKLYRCSGCGVDAFEQRAVCRRCRGEVFTEVESGDPVNIVSSLLTVTPAGFDDSYSIAMGSVGNTRVLYSIPVNSVKESGHTHTD